MEIGANQNPNLPVAVSEPPPPVGYRFLPTDFELLDHYLRRLIHEQLLPELYPKIICADIYADHPFAIWNLGDAHDDTGSRSELHSYFFTKLESIGKSRRGKKMGRRVGAHGTWHMSCTRNTKVKNGDQVLGYNKYFNYQPITIHPGDVEYKWSMHEFTLHDSHDSTYHALCKITRRMRKKPLQGVVDEPVMLSNQHQQGDHIGFGEIVLSSQRGDTAKQVNLELSPESIACSSNKVFAHDEIVTPPVGSSSSSTTFENQPLLDCFSQFENTDFNDDALYETQWGHPQQGIIVTTPSETFKLEDFDDIFLDLEDFIQIDDVRDEDYYQPKVGPIGSQQITTYKRARVEEGTRCADEAKKARHC